MVVPPVDWTLPDQTRNDALRDARGKGAKAVSKSLFELACDFFVHRIDEAVGIGRSHRFHMRR